MPNGNIPNTGQKTVQANMTVKSFVSPENPSAEQLKKYDKDVNAFLKTIDNKKRFLNGRNAYSVGDRIYILIWYLERLADEPVTTPFGPKVKPATPVTKDEKQPEVSPAEEKKAG